MKEDNEQTDLSQLGELTRSKNIYKNGSQTGGSMTLSEQLHDYIAACFSAIWIRSDEHEDAFTEIQTLCRENEWRLATWDIASGFNRQFMKDDEEAGSTDPVSALLSLNAIGDPMSTTVLVLSNFHRFMGSSEVIQTLVRQVSLGKRNRTFVVVLAPTVQIPIELEKQFVVLEHAYPDRTQLEAIARSIANEDELPIGAEFERLLDASAGLTRFEAEGAFSLSLIRQGALRPDSVWELKSQTLKKNGLLNLHRGQEKFETLGGLENLKSFCTQVLTHRTHEDHSVVSRGVLLLGVPGTGKSAFAKALGNQTNRPTLTLDIGSLMGSFVGQSESNIRRALQIADAMAPCILYVDELDKAMAGAGNSGQSDSGVSARMLGTLLTWLNDHTTDVFVVATCNDASKLPPEFTRAERFDGVFFLDLPSSEQREQIWQICLMEFGLDPDQPTPPSENWTGAEIRSCCRLARLLNVSLIQAALNVVPIACTASESISSLREWASDRCLDAERPGIFKQTNQASRPNLTIAKGNPSIN